MLIIILLFAQALFLYCIAFVSNLDMCQNLLRAYLGLQYIKIKILVLIHTQNCLRL